MNTFINAIKKQVIILIIIILSSTGLTGCADSSQIEQTAIVLALGFDASKNGVTVTMQILRNQGSPQLPKVDIYTGNATDADSAIYKIRSEVGKKFLYSHLKCFIIGETIALKSIAPLLDVTLRFSEIRPTVPLLVTKGNASDIIKTNSKDNTISSLSIENAIDVQKKLGYSASSTNLNFATSINTPPNITSCSVIDIDKNYFEQGTDGNATCYTFPGNAVFRKDKLIGYMDSNEVRGLNWTRGKIRWGNLKIETLDKKPLNLDIRRSSCKRTVSIKNGKIIFRLNIKVDSAIRDMAGNTDPNKNPNLLLVLEARENEAIRSEVKLAIDDAQNVLRADVFDFGDLLYKTHPKEWSKLKENWTKIFPNVPIEVTVDSNITQTGTIAKPQS
ncbi:Ger(x)C family spore germination protein [Clostridium akagii]|uniref:Ger(x)C family spore germination protein n=1 Tax=Clostridium akagii TaxID=91623 RepID=UPI00047D0CB5|nr:Ger(x)C family spore germination protein [Clostridium akagii]